MEKGSVFIKTKKGEGRKYSIDTIKAYKVLFSKIGEYSRGKDIPFEKIDSKFNEKFQGFMYDQNFSANYYGNFIKNLKATMQRAFEEELHTNLAFKKFKAIKVESTSIALTDSELRTLKKLEFKNPKYEKYRDIFLLGCYTALRFSDYRRIAKEHIKEQQDFKVIEIIVKKGSQKLVIPLRPEAIQILEKYEYRLPKISRQKLNDALKEIKKIAGFNEMIETQKIKGGKEIIKMVPKFELMKTHVARRTGATLMYKAGIPTLDIAEITGHRTESQLLKYIKVTKKETAKRLALNAFFKGVPLAAI